MITQTLEFRLMLMTKIPQLHHLQKKSRKCKLMQPKLRYQLKNNREWTNLEQRSTKEKDQIRTWPYSKTSMTNFKIKVLLNKLLKVQLKILHLELLLQMKLDHLIK